MRIFLDANILFSAAYSDSAIRRLLKDLQVSDCALVVSHYVLEEALRNLSVHKSEAIAVLHRLIAAFIVVPTVLTSPHIPPEIQLPEKDIPVLASAIAAECTILMTGDTRHFGPYFGRTIGALTICSPVEIARRVTGIQDHQSFGG